jgi:predicted RNA binding protein YcfA (HicA-like mRNA interferase family)
MNFIRTFCLVDEAWEMLYMGEQDGLLLRILRGTSDANIPFDGLCHLLQRLGFTERIRGSHHIFTKEGIAEILNLQPKGRQAKPYQVKQVRRVILKYRLGGAADVL